METPKKGQILQALNCLSEAVLRLTLAGACFVLSSSGQSGAAEASVFAKASAVPLPIPRPIVASGNRQDASIQQSQRSPSIAAQAPNAPSLDLSSKGSAGNAGDSIELPMFDSKSAERMGNALARYKSMQNALPPGPIAIHAKITPNVIRSVAARLIAEGFLPANYRSGNKSDAVMREAVHKWQRDYGLSETGVLDLATRVELNVPMSVRVRQLEASISRVKALHPLPARFYVIVNAAAARVQIVDGDAVREGLPAIVGKDTRKTPEFVSRIPYLQLMPTWTPTRSIVRKEIVPLVRRDQGYLARHQMRAMFGHRVVEPSAVNWRRGPFPTIVQRPGPENPLGFIRFGIGNGGAYYIHGTPQTNLLARSLRYRFLSHGCVRLADPVSFGAILLQHSNPSWTVDELRAHIEHFDGGWQPGERISLVVPVPVYWIYLTAWTTADGQTHFRRDMYGRDARTELALSE